MTGEKDRKTIRGSASRRAWFAAATIAAAALAGRVVFEGKEPPWLDYVSLAVALLAVAVALACHVPSTDADARRETQAVGSPPELSKIAEEHARSAKRCWLAGAVLAVLTVAVGAVTGFDQSYGWLAYLGGALAAAAFIVSLGFVVAQHRALLRRDATAASK